MFGRLVAIDIVYSCLKARLFDLYSFIKEKQSLLKVLNFSDSIGHFPSRKDEPLYSKKGVSEDLKDMVV